jgi:SHS2 domain-containing protein
MGRYELVEDITRADCAIEVVAGGVEDLFATAARALAELSADPSTVSLRRTRDVRLSAADLELLLFDWLNEIILRKDRDREVYPQVDVEISGQGPFELSGRLQGDVIGEATEQRADLKAVTLHQFQLEVADHACRARFVVDL